MQAPKDGDAFAAAWGDLKALQGDRKRLDEPQATAGQGVGFVTSNRDSPRQAEVKAMSDAFTRGFAKGLEPFRMFDLRIDSHVNADSTYYRLGTAGVRVSGLELMQAEDVEALGHVKGVALRLAHQGEALKRDIEGVLFKQEYPAVDEAIGDALTGGVGWMRMARVDPAEALPEEATVPMPTVLGWTGGGHPAGAYARVTLGIEGASVVYVPERAGMKPGVSDFDHWYASEYTRVLERHIRKLQDSVNAADGMLSQVLHEMAGEASLCWDPKPAGVFDSSKAIEAVERAIKQLRSILREV